MSGIAGKLRDRADDEHPKQRRRPAASQIERCS
jgi:hypothetical protein